MASAKTTAAQQSLLNGNLSQFSGSRALIAVSRWNITGAKKEHLWSVAAHSIRCRHGSHHRLRAVGAIAGLVQATRLNGAAAKQRKRAHPLWPRSPRRYGAPHWQKRRGCIEAIRRQRSCLLELPRECGAPAVRGTFGLNFRLVPTDLERSGDHAGPAHQWLHDPEHERLTSAGEWAGDAGADRLYEIGRASCRERV